MNEMEATRSNGLAFFVRILRPGGRRAMNHAGQANPFLAKDVYLRAFLENLFIDSRF